MNPVIGGCVLFVVLTVSLFSLVSMRAFWFACASASTLTAMGTIIHGVVFNAIGPALFFGGAIALFALVGWVQWYLEGPSSTNSVFRPFVPSSW